ncbi:hypothetical protein GOODEAATRI_033171 [Goodea atripinnis]|uniref:Uncharacterized protein n=1 Tax=Goodea atripinnis TaxID=208336 RepID=A0ABV0Q3T9_9TELE
MDQRTKGANQRENQEDEGGWLINTNEQGVQDLSVLGLCVCLLFAVTLFVILLVTLTAVFAIHLPELLSICGQSVSLSFIKSFQSYPLCSALWSYLNTHHDR